MDDAASCAAQCENNNDANDEVIAEVGDDTNGKGNDGHAAVHAKATNRPIALASTVVLGTPLKTKRGASGVVSGQADESTCRRCRNSDSRRGRWPQAARSWETILPP
ncbi:MAG: hypothetical protein ACKO38_21790, partial [Planctomycetota bacterium]